MGIFEYFKSRKVKTSCTLSQPMVHTLSIALKFRSNLKANAYYPKIGNKIFKTFNTN